MGGIIKALTSMFNSPEPPIRPAGPDPEMVKAQREQEERIEAREAQSKKEISSRKRARRRGGARALLSERDNPFLGVPTQTTLGPSYSRDKSGRTR